ncbi:IcmT/TraK family protein [Pseudoxanthomonas kaohsiungensis]|uniref:IcmT/TraK family protein n=1 Tax=Pseudoxanthomonas kaohsiungensis TaxID=283923 RepID=A0ABW3LXB0_9GAMM|nr:phosphoesterase [Pseudoxanthomonas kaohsiungensis]
MPRPNVWRDSAETTRLWVFDALAGFPLILMLLHLRWWTFGVAVTCFVVFGVLERMGYSVRFALRRLRAIAGGSVKLGQPWWGKRQERL